MRPRKAAPLDIVATRAPGAASSSGSRRTVSANGPRALLAVWSSNPSTVRGRSGTAITPALLTSRSSGRPCARSPSANSRTEARSARSRRRTSVVAPGTRACRRDRAASPRSVERTASTTWAPAPASRAAASSPVPLLAPETTAVRPVRSGTRYTAGLLPLNRPSVCCTGTLTDQRSLHNGPLVRNLCRMTFRRARSDEQREERRRAILETTAAMLGEMPVAQVSLNEISRRVGLAKSNVLRYVESREAALLDLLHARTQEWLDALAEQP